MILRVKAGVADNGFAAGEVSGTLARNDNDCLVIHNVLLVLPQDATQADSDVVVGGKTFALGDTLTAAGGFFPPDAVAQMMDSDGLRSWKACGAPAQTVVVADPSTVT